MDPSTRFIGEPAWHERHGKENMMYVRPIIHSVFHCYPLKNAIFIHKCIRNKSINVCTCPPLSCSYSVTVKNVIQICFFFTLSSSSLSSSLCLFCLWFTYSVLLSFYSWILFNAICEDCEPTWNTGLWSDTLSLEGFLITPKSTSLHHTHSDP